MPYNPIAPVFGATDNFSHIYHNMFDPFNGDRVPCAWTCYCALDLIGGNLAPIVNEFCNIYSVFTPFIGEWLLEFGLGSECC